MTLRSLVAMTATPIFIFSASSSLAASTLKDTLGDIFSPISKVVLADRSLNRVLDDLAEQAQQHSLQNAELWKAQAPKELASCKAQFEDYVKDGLLKINVAYGYIDWPEAGRNLDQEKFELLYKALTRSCSGASNVCGFTEVERVYLSRAVLERQLNVRMDGVDRSFPVRITLAYSSRDVRDKDNFENGVPSAGQIATSERAEKVFFEGIGENGVVGDTCDVCAYVGHARNGGGPDFRPVPRAWRVQGGEPNYAYYLAEKTNFRRLMKALQTTKHPSSQLIAIMGCNSHEKFYSAGSRTCVNRGAANCPKTSLRDFTDKFGFYLTEKLSWPQNNPLYVGVLMDGVLGFKCRSAWEENLAPLHIIPKYPEAYGIFGRFLQPGLMPVVRASSMAVPQVELAPW